MTNSILYKDWRRLHLPLLETLPERDILMLFSGGKDSSTALDLLMTAGMEFGFQLTVRAGAYPVHRYSFGDRERISDYWHGRGIEIHWHDLAVDDSAIDAAEDPCKVCQRLRKKMLARFLGETQPQWEKLIIVTSYSLWDLVSYSLEHILGGMLAAGGDTEDRFMETAQRFYPMLHMKEGYKVFRPLITFNSTEIQKRIQQQGIPTLSSPCRYGQFRPKRILEDYYARMGLNFDYEKLIDFARKSLKMPSASSYESIDSKEYLSALF